MNKQTDWEYKVVETDKLTQELQNHDIAVSQEAANSRRENSKTNLETSLNNFGTDGWEFFTLIGEFGIFKRPKSSL